MACSNPIKIYEPRKSSTIKKESHISFKNIAQFRSFGHDDFLTVPCRYCLNCRVDRQNEMIDRCEYEYIKYGCGSFVTFTYDDVHNQKNGFIDSHSAEFVYSINKKDGKDFLNRLNKLVHKENKRLKKLGIKNNPLCREDYKYVITSEYGDKLKRNHFHALFFGLDFAYCERLFWRAWQYQGAIEVGAIKNGGIAYCVKYIDSLCYGTEKTFKYLYHHLTPPSSSHSIGLGEGLYLSQLKYIKEHNGYYHWHGVDRPLPSYYKNKYKIISDLNFEYMKNKYQANCNHIYNLYEKRIVNYEDYKNTLVELAKQRKKNLEIKMVQNGKQIYQPEYIAIQKNDILYKDNHRLNPNLDNLIVRVIDINGNPQLKYDNKKVTLPLTNTKCMKMKTSYNQLVKQFGYKITDEMFGLDPIPF